MQSRAPYYTFLFLLIGLLAWTGWMVLPYMLAVLMGGILALLSAPLYRRLTLRGMGRKWSATLTTLAVLLLLVGPLALFSARAIGQAVSLGQYLSQNDALSVHALVARVANWGPAQTWVGSPAVLEKQVQSGIQNAGRAASGMVLILAASLPEIGLQLALAMLSCFFLLMDGRKFVNWITHKVPMEETVRGKTIETFRNTAISTIYATLAAATAQAAMMLVAFIVCGVPAAFLAAGATFIFAWIPMLGSVPVAIAGLIYLYVQGAWAKLIIMAVLALATSVVDNLVRPLVLKGRGDMHPLVSLVAIFGGIQMFGIFGVFVGPIIVALLIAMLEIFPLMSRKASHMPLPVAVTPTPGLSTELTNAESSVSKKA